MKRHSSVLLPPFGRTGKAVRDATGMRRGPSARRLLLSAGWVGPWTLQVSCPAREGGRRETQLFLQLSGREESRGQGDLRTGSLRASRTRPPRTLQRGRPVRGRAPPEGALDLRVRGAAGASGAAAGGLVRAVRAGLAWRGAGDQKESLCPQKSARKLKGQIFQGPSPEQSGQRTYKSDADHTKCPYCSLCTTYCS